MKNYTCRAHFHNDEFMWSIHENTTDQTIASYYFEEDAISLARHLNRGGGFAGFTPSFFLLPFEVKKDDIDQEFSNYISE
jgi:hypothetical protein